MSASDIKTIEEISAHCDFISENVEKMVQARKVANRITSEREKAIAYHDTVEP